MSFDVDLFSHVGTKIQTTDTAKLLKEAEFNFGISERDLYYLPNAQQGFTRLANRKAILRKGTDKVLGVVKDRYSYVNMIEALYLFDQFIEEGHLSYEYAGTSSTKIGEGLKFWVLLKLNEDYYEVSKDDLILPYLLVSNSFDGSTALSIRSTAIRVTCWNLTHLLLREGGDKYMVKHTGSARNRFVKGGKQFLEQLLISNQKTIKAYNRMNEIKFTYENFREYLKAVFPVQIKDDREWTHESTLSSYFSKGDEHCNPNTIYSAYNAVTKLLTYDLGKTEDMRFYNFHWGSNVSLGNRAFKIAFDLSNRII